MAKKTRVQGPDELTFASVSPISHIFVAAGVLYTRSPSACGAAYDGWGSCWSVGAPGHVSSGHHKDAHAGPSSPRAAGRVVSDTSVILLCLLVLHSLANAHQNSTLTYSFESRPLQFQGCLRLIHLYSAASWLCSFASIVSSAQARRRKRALRRVLGSRLQCRVRVWI